MTSEIRASTLKNRVGLGTVSFTNTGPVVSGIVTIANSTAEGVTLEDNAGVGGSLKITTPSGYVSIGAGNAAFVHLNTDRGSYYFQKRIIVDEGIIGSYDENLTLQSPLNTNRVTINKDTGLVSILNDLDVDGHTNLDNVNIVGVTTTNGNLNVNGVSYLYGNGGAAVVWGNTGYSGHLTFDGSNNAVIRAASGKALIIQTNHVNEKLRITSGGRIGIGTDNPGSEVHLQSTAPVIKVDATNNQSGLRFDILGQTGGTNNQLFRVQRDGTTKLQLNDDGDLVITGDDNSELKLKAGTATGNGIIAFLNSSGTTKGNIFYDTDDNFMVFKTNGTASSNERLRITSTGAVNIGGNYTQTSYQLSVRGGAVDQSTQFSNTKTGNGDIHYIGINLNDGSTGMALFGHTGHTTAGSQAAWMGLAGDDVAGGVGVKCYKGGTVQMGSSTTLQAFINNSVSGHQFISQCSDNNNGFEIYQKHGSTATRKTLAVYANTGNSAAKQIQFEVRGDNSTHAYGTKNTSPFTLSTAIGPSGAHSYGDENRLDFLMYNEIPQFTGNPAARIAGYLQRGNNGFGLRFYARTNASTLFKAMEITADYEVLPGSNGTVDLGNASNRWKNVYTSDLDLSNEAKGGNDVDGTWGSYTIQEGESDLFLINKRNGKKYKFNLTEVS